MALIAGQYMQRPCGDDEIVNVDDGEKVQQE